MQTSWREHAEKPKERKRKEQGSSQYVFVSDTKHTPDSRGFFCSSPLRFLPIYLSFVYLSSVFLSIHLSADIRLKVYEAPSCRRNWRPHASETWKDVHGRKTATQRRVYTPKCVAWTLYYMRYFLSVHRESTPLARPYRGRSWTEKRKKRQRERKPPLTSKKRPNAL